MALVNRLADGGLDVLQLVEGGVHLGGEAGHPPPGRTPRCCCGWEMPSVTSLLALVFMVLYSPFLSYRHQPADAGGVQDPPGLLGHVPHQQAAVQQRARRISAMPELSMNVTP